MVAKDLKEFNNQWIMFGLLFVCLISFASVFMASNNPEGLGSAQDKFDAYGNDMTSKLVTVEGTGNSLLNISAETNPEAGLLGSRDSVATSYGTMGNAKGFVDSFKLFMGWMFAGTNGTLLISVLIGMFSLTALLLIIKKVRQG